MGTTVHLEVERSTLSRKLVLVEWCAMAMLSLYFAVHAFVPAWRTLNTDFPNYYCVARLHLDGVSVDRAYEWVWLQRQKDTLGITQPLVGFAPHPPFCAAPLLALAKLPPLTAKRIWLLVNLGLLGSSVVLISLSTSLTLRRAILLALLCLVPLESNFLLGQYYVALLFLICLAFFLKTRGSPFSSGVALGIATALKLFPALFILLFVFRRQWRAVVGLVFGTASCTAFAIATLGWQLHRTFLIEVLPRAMSGDALGPYSAKWSSFVALWHRLFLLEPELNPSPLLNSPAAYAVATAGTVTLLLYLFSRTMLWHEEGAAEWSALVCLALLLSPMPSSYHYCLLIFAASAAIAQREGIAEFTVGVLYLLACLPVRAIGSGLQLSSRLLASLALFLTTVTHRNRERVPLSLKVAAACIALLLALTNFRTRQGREADYLSRINLNVPAYSYVSPVRYRCGLAAIAMRDDGYSGIIDGHLLAPQIVRGDILSISAAGNSGPIYFELSTANGSEIRRLHGTSSTGSELIEAGEQPSVSPNGKWLSFVREERGRGTAWLHDVIQHRTQQISAADIDVYELSTANSGEVYFAGSSNGKLRIFRWSAGKSVLMPIAGWVRYPTVSEDESKLAFSRRESGAWHIFVRTLATGAEQRITRGNCNSTEASWKDAHTLFYATDCGRGLGLTAIAEAGVD